MSTCMTRRAFLRTAGVSSAAIVLSACGATATPTTAPVATKAPEATKPPAVATAAPTKAPAAPATAAAGTAKSGGRVVMGSPQEPDRYWTPFTGLTVAQEVGVMINHPLIGLDDKNKYFPYLLTEVPTAQNGGISADSLTWTLKLRSDVKWHDGQPFSSKDVRFTYDMMMLKDTDVNSRAGWDKIVSVDMPNANTAVIKFSEVVAPFLTNLVSVPILPEHLLKGLTAKEFNANKWFRAPVGTGPFMFKEWLPGDRITIVKNPNYFVKGQPYLDEIVYRIVPDANTLVNMVETGQVDIYVRIPDDLALLLDKMSKVTRTTVQSLTPWLIWTNVNNPILKDKRVRQALAYGFDKELICKQVFRGLSEPADSAISPQLAAANPSLMKFRRDVEKAKALLEQAGWKDTNNDGIREAKGVDGVADGTLLAIETASIAGEQIRTQLLSLVQAQWKDIGVKAELKLVDVGTLFGNMHPNNNFVTTYSYIGRGPDPDLAALYLDRVKFNNKNNYTGYNNPKVEELILAANKTADQEKRNQNFREASAIIAEDAPQFFIGWRANSTSTSSRLRGYKPSPGWLEYWNAAEYWVD